VVRWCGGAVVWWSGIRSSGNVHKHTED
jgi:hypothetical protein